jgi:hypothetical protein
VKFNEELEDLDNILDVVIETNEHVFEKDFVE